MREIKVLRGRGANTNPNPRFDSWTRAREEDGPCSDLPIEPNLVQTEVTVETAKSALARNTSSDVPFDQSINPYRGCEHGCSYCFSRPSHAYIGLSPGLDFETKLFAKSNAAELLRGELNRKGYQPAVIGLGSNTDPYQPIEREHQITRKILEVLEAHRHPVAITTKSSLVVRDADILARMAEQGLASVSLSVATLDSALARKLEPRANRPAKRIEAIHRLSSLGIPCGVAVAPVIPALTDFDIENVLREAAAAGATSAGYVMLRLPLEVHDIFVMPRLQFFWTQIWGKTWVPNWSC